MSTCESGNGGFRTEYDESELWFCDTFSLMGGSMLPVGDGSMLLIDGADVSVVGGEDDSDLDPWESVVSDWVGKHF